METQQQDIGTGPASTSAEDDENRPSYQSGKRDSNPRRSAWEADALPTELLPLAGAKLARSGTTGDDPLRAMQRFTLTYI